jgi:glycosyltransferase involved in cell wall biosynthesis
LPEDRSVTLPMPALPVTCALQDSTERHNALFVIHNLRLGGAERTLLTYVNHAQRFRPTVLLVQRDVELMQELNPSVRLYDLSARRARALIERDFPPLPLPASHTATHFRRVREYVSEPLLIPLLWRAYRLHRLAEETGALMVSSFLNKSHIIALFAKLFFNPRLRVVINAHELLSQHVDHFFSPPGRVLMRRLVRTLFPHADRFVAVAAGVRQDLIRNFSLPAERIVVVHNPLDLERIRQRACEAATSADHTAAEGPLIVAVGRLVKLKGFDLLLRAFARLRRQAGTRLMILGEGPERRALERLIRELDLGERVSLVGRQENPWKYMARADVFVLSSLTEAFPNVIGEALALGRPVLATDCSPGIREFLADGECGLLAPPGDAAALADGLERLLRAPELRLRLANAGLRRAEAFDLPPTVRRYEAALLGALDPVR